MSRRAVALCSRIGSLRKKSCPWGLAVNNAGSFSGTGSSLRGPEQACPDDTQTLPNARMDAREKTGTQQDKPVGKARVPPLQCNHKLAAPRDAGQKQRQRG